MPERAGCENMFDMIDMIVILVIAGITAFFYLFTSWGAAYTASVEDDMLAEAKAKAEGIDTYCAWRVIKGKVLEWKKKGMASVVWFEVIAMTILGAISTVVVMDQVAFLNGLDITGTILAAGIGGVGLAYFWEFATKWFVEEQLDKVKAKIYEGLGNVENAIAKLKQSLMPTEPKT